MKINLDEYNFAESESYEIIDSEENEEVSDVSERLTSFLQDRSFGGLVKKGIIVFVILTYILWMSSQFYLSLISDIKIGVLPHRVVYNVLSTVPGVGLLLAIFSALMSSALMFAFSQKAKKEEGYKISDNITHGSADFATDEKMRGAVVFHELDNPEGVVIGRKEVAPNVLFDEAFGRLEKLDGEVAVCVDNKIIRRNMNFAVFGSSGAGKSWSFVKPNLLARIACKESFCVTDPSGEHYRDIAAIAEANGYIVRILNLSSPSSSNGWNPFDVLQSVDPMEVQMLTATLVHTILSNTTDENAKADVFFDQSEENLLKALILYVAISPHFKGEPHERHMGTVYDLLTKLAAQEGILEEFAELPDSDPAKAPWKMFQGAGRLKTNFITGLASRLEIFQVDMIKEIFSHSEINLSAMGQEPCAYFIVTSVSNDKTKFILSLFFSCVFEQLINDAVAAGGELKVPVFFFLDEFKAIGRINSFADKVANVRKYGISISMIFQDLNQLEKAYPNDAESILSNCDTWVALGVNDMPTAEKLSQRSGIATVLAEMQGYNRLKRTPIAPIDPMLQIRETDTKRYLMNPDEIITYFDNMGTFETKVLIFARNKFVYRANTYPWTLHRLVNDVSLDLRNINEYIPEWQKGEWTINKKRSFLDSDTNNSSELTYGGKSKERDEYKERARGHEEDIRDKAKKKPGGIVFNANAESTHLVELGLNLSGQKKV